MFTVSGLPSCRKEALREQGTCGCLPRASSRPMQADVLSLHLLNEGTDCLKGCV